MNKKLSESKEIQALEARKTDAISIAESVVVKNTADKKAALNYIAVANAIIQDTLKKRKKIVPKLHEAHRAACDMFAELTDPLNKEIGIVKEKISSFDIAERTRIHEENRKRILEADKKEAAKQERLRKRAEDLDNQDRPEEAEAKREEAEMAITPAPEIEAVEKTMKTDVGSFTTTYMKKGKIVDDRAFLQAVIDNHLPPGVWDENQSGVDAYVKAFDPKVGTVINGIKIIEVARSTFRGKK